MCHDFRLERGSRGTARSASTFASFLRKSGAKKEPDNINGIGAERNAGRHLYEWRRAERQTMLGSKLGGGKD